MVKGRLSTDWGVTMTAVCLLPAVNSLKPLHELALKPGNLPITFQVLVTKAAWQRRQDLGLGRRGLRAPRGQFKEMEWPAVRQLHEFYLWKMAQCLSCMTLRLFEDKWMLEGGNKNCQCGSYVVQMMYDKINPLGSHFKCLLGVFHKWCRHQSWSQHHQDLLCKQENYKFTAHVPFRGFLVLGVSVPSSETQPGL